MSQICSSIHCEIKCNFHRKCVWKIVSMHTFMVMANLFDGWNIVRSSMSLRCCCDPIITFPNEHYINKKKSTMKSRHLSGVREAWFMGNQRKKNSSTNDSNDLVSDIINVFITVKWLFKLHGKENLLLEESCSICSVWVKKKEMAYYFFFLVAKRKLQLFY